MLHAWCCLSGSHSDSLHPPHLLYLGPEPSGPRPRMSLAWEAKLVRSLVRRGLGGDRRGLEK